MSLLKELYNFTKQEYTNVGLYSCNTKNWMESPLANFYFFMKNQYWSDTDDVQFLNDAGDAYYDLREVWKDITKEAVKEYNEIAQDHIEYYGDDDIQKIYTHEEYQARKLTK